MPTTDVTSGGDTPTEEADEAAGPTALPATGNGDIAFSDASGRSTTPLLLLGLLFVVSLAGLGTFAAQRLR